VPTRPLPCTALARGKAPTRRTPGQIAPQRVVRQHHPVHPLHPPPPRRRLQRLGRRAARLCGRPGCRGRLRLRGGARCVRPRGFVEDGPEVPENMSRAERRDNTSQSEWRDDASQSEWLESMSRLEWRDDMNRSEWLDIMSHSKW
jgi:hypothetical protein